MDLFLDVVGRTKLVVSYIICDDGFIVVFWFVECSPLSVIYSLSSWPCMIPDGAFNAEGLKMNYNYFCPLSRQSSDIYIYIYM